MPEAVTPTTIRHGAKRLPAVEVLDYNVELRCEDGFLGDNANKAAFRAMLDDWRKVLRKRGDDPFGDEPTKEISKKKLDAVLAAGDPEAAGVLQGAIEEFSQELARVVRELLKLKTWRDTECLAVGGGFRETRVGELAIGRAGASLKAHEVGVSLEPIRNAPPEAGRTGALHLAPPRRFKGYAPVG